MPTHVGRSQGLHVGSGEPWKHLSEARWNFGGTSTDSIYRLKGESWGTVGRGGGGESGGSDSSLYSAFEPGNLGFTSHTYIIDEILAYSGVF